jgi:FtsP/CotA-like multicopper oxidase with cupredoxin domain
MAAATAASPIPRTIQINDNLRPAGKADGSLLNLQLVADVGSWHPAGANGPPLEVAAFGEEGGELSVPGPLIRAREGTTVVVSLRNALSSTLRVFGLCAKPGPCEPIAVAPGASREVRFALNAPGTFYYWGSTSVSAISARPRAESQLGGAIVVDAREGPAADRVMVISIFDDGRQMGSCGLPGKGAVFTINGASWPYTARLKYTVGETVRWRVINLSCDLHAMHLHGFHFTIHSSGDGTTDRQLAPDQQRTEVTEPIPPGRIFMMAWVPTRAGNWLFHCHMVPHMAASPNDVHAGHAGVTHAGMAGLVVGIEVTGPNAWQQPPATPVKRFSLLLSEEPNRYGTRAGYRMDLEGIDAPRLDTGPVPGPVMVLHRGDPVEITIDNRMTEPTAIHWHGIELESYYDGVPGFGGLGGTIASPIAPGQSFVVRFTPPHAGTFIYHTHWHDEAQLAGGLYGALLVLEPGERYDPRVDHVVVIGLNGVLVPGEREPFAVNGRAIPAPIRMRVGVPNRIRLVNITATNVGLSASLLDQSELKRWKPIGKDGAALPPAQREPRLGRQSVAVGETYDFEITPDEPQNLWLEVRRGSGEWVLQVPVQVR